MKSKQIELGIIDGQDEDVLDKIIRFIEISHLKKALSENDRYYLENLVLNIDKQIQDLNDKKDEVSKVIKEKTILLLKCLVSVLNDCNFNHDELIFLRHFLNELYISINAIEETGIENFFIIISRMKYEIAFMPKIVIKESHLTTFRNERKKIIKEKRRRKELKIKAIEIEIFLRHEKDSVSLQTLAVFIEVFSSIDGVNVILEDIIKGSIISRLILFFQSPEAKKEAIELLESTKKFALGKLEKEYSESEKFKMETEKIEVEKLQLLNSISSENSEDSMKKKALEIEALELENHRKKLENQKLELELLKEKTLFLNELLVNQLMTQEEFQILINKELFVTKIGEKTIEGKSIIEIERNDY